MTLAAITLLAILPAAQAESATLMQKGAGVLYGGPGATTYSQLNTGPEGGTEAQREVSHALQARLDLFGGWQPAERLAFYAYLPVVYSTVIGGPISPCSNGAQGNCAPVAGIGSAAVQARVAILRGPVALTAGLGLSSGAWNADIRRRYTMVGEASTDLLPALYVGWNGRLGGVPVGAMAYGSYAARFPTYPQPDLAEKAPADDVRAGVEVKAGKGPVEFTVGAATIQRLGGADFFAYPDSDDVWATVDYDAISVNGKISLSLPKNMGLHLGASRVVWVHNGPVDATDITLGVHRYFPP